MFNRRGSSRSPYPKSNFRRPFRSGTRNRFGGAKKTARSVEEYIAQASQKITLPPSQSEPVTTQTFDQLPLDKALLLTIQQLGFTTLTPIQQQCIPAVLEKKDVVGIAQTGTGKTAAFLIPLIQNCIQNPSYKALIVAPTRELAMQIRDEFKRFAGSERVYPALCIGKSSMYNQISQLRRNPHVVIGTPGRLKDHIERRTLKLAQFQMVVLDEVDRMLDMGFIQDMKQILSSFPQSRQSLFFSATVSQNIQNLIQSFSKNPVIISVKTQETTQQINQQMIKVKEGSTKVDTLHTMLLQGEYTKVLIFGRTKMGVEKLYRELFKRGHKVTSIHGDKPQYERQQAIRQFKEHMVKILVATDVAARGLDIPHVSHVVNFDIPDTYEDYIHRIGRTGRAQESGTAITLIEESPAPQYRQSYQPRTQFHHNGPPRRQYS